MRERRETVSKQRPPDSVVLECKPHQWGTFPSEGGGLSSSRPTRAHGGSWQIVEMHSRAVLEMVRLLFTSRVGASEKTPGHCGESIREKNLGRSCFPSILFGRRLSSSSTSPTAVRRRGGPSLQNVPDSTAKRDTWRRETPGTGKGYAVHSFGRYGPSE